MNAAAHIASVIVRARPEQAATVAARIAATPGHEVHAVADGKVIVVIEADTERALADSMDHLRQEPDVMLVSLVYHEVDHLWVGEHAAILPIAYPRSILLRRPWIEGLWASPLSRAHLDTVVVGDSAAATPAEPAVVPVPDEA